MTARRQSGGRKTAAIRQADFVVRMERKGLRKVAVWVPDGAQATIRETAASLRAAADRKLAKTAPDDGAA